MTSPTDLPVVVQYLEDLLERARRGEVHVLVASALVYDPVKVEMGVRVGVGVSEHLQADHPLAAQREAFAKVTEGAAIALRHADQGLSGALLPPAAPPSGSGPVH